MISVAIRATAPPQHRRDVFAFILNVDASASCQSRTHITISHIPNDLSNHAEDPPLHQCKNSVFQPACTAYCRDRLRRPRGYTLLDRWTQGIPGSLYFLNFDLVHRICVGGLLGVRTGRMRGRGVGCHSLLTKTIYHMRGLLRPSHGEVIYRPECCENTRRGLSSAAAGVTA